jgi:Trk-type K+ transport system membrane component
MTPRPDESQRRVIERRRALSPAKVVALSFLAAIAVGTLLLLLPFSQTPGQPVSLLDAFFTATSALCVTGLVVVDTGSAWTPFGQGVILLLIHIGGLGLVTLGTLLALFVLSATQDLPLLPLMFETFSAFGTVGLSTGVTGELNPAGKLLVIVLMYLGRIGPTTFAIALLQQAHADRIKYPEEGVLVG